MASKIFEEVFDSHCGGIVRDCSCGITHFDTYNQGCDWEEGELEGLEENAKNNPDRYRGHDHSIGTMEIGGHEIVFGCTCDLADKYEKFILNHAVQLKEYLNQRAKMLRERADEIDMSGD